MAKAKEIGVAYALLDMKHGETLADAEKQIREISKKKPGEWYFDLLHTPNQTPTAMAWMEKVTWLIQVYSKVAAWKITVKLNTNDRPLRARNALFEKAYQAGAAVKDEVAE